ncbi:MAG: DUF1080 domain-containing protein [Planctomycetes bacterium]|nr:DUF1080 domain-containing protein [Planctomycetota bacterium]
MSSWSINTVVASIVIAGLSMMETASAGEPVVLFDGKTLDNWDVITCEAEVQDGAILLKSGNGLVQTKKRYADYIFECEWKALKAEGWDSGVYFRYDEVPEGRPWPQRYQVNLRVGMEGDLAGFKDGRNTIATKPRDWNRFELTVKGTTVALKVNGKDAWKVDGLEQSSGFIALQSEVPGGGQFLFRNIRITELAKD